MEDSSTDKLVEGNFGFGFNDVDFSDRVLRLEMIPALASNSNPGVEKYLNIFSSVQDDSSVYGTGLIVKTLNICSLMLAAKSSFFYKLFKNGMRESQNKNEVTLRINASEEAALMDLLNFIYGKPLNATSEGELLDVLIAADKFGVTCCVRHCIQLLLKLPMSTESALFYMELPSVVFVAEVIQPLIDAANQYIAAQYNDFTESRQEAAMALPLSAIEAVLGSDGLQVDSEEAVFDFVLKWGRSHYPKLEERREILTKCLMRFICIPYMSDSKLKEVVECPDFDYEQASKLVLKVLFTNVEFPYCRSKSIPVNESDFPRRVYSHRRVVFLDIKKEDCAALYQTVSRIYSEAFWLGERCLTFLARYSQNQFGLFIRMTGSEACPIYFEFAAMKQPSREFQTQFSSRCTLTATEKSKGQWLFNWTELMSDDSVYFIDGILHLQAIISLDN